MTYGETFQDIKPIDDYINFNIGFFNEFREYLKEKSELERKHAKESDTLIQKFSQRLDKKKQSLNLLLNAPNSIGAGNEGSVMSDSRPQTPTTHIPTMNSPQTPTTPSNEFKSKDYFSYIKAWSSLLNQMKENNNYRLKFCDKLGSTIDKMKTQIVIKEDEKKNYIQNLKNINNKIEEYVIEKNNAKKKYFDSCDLLGNQKKKLTRKDSTLSDVESSTDKSVKKIDGAQVDVDNKKNLYLLSLHSLNELKKKVHNEYIPDLFNNLQECQECIINAFQLYTQDYVRLEQKLTEDIKNNFNNALEDINIINSNNDNIVFENEKKEDIIPLEIEKFVRYFNEEGNYTITNKSSIYLSNLKDSLISQLTKDQEKFNISKSRFNNSKTHNHAYNINPSNVNCRSVMEEQTKLWNIVHMDEIPIVIKKSKIEVITGIIENEKLENPHDFKVQMFINAVCDYCHEKVRGNGLKCKSCSFICHKNKCESEVPKRCTGIKVDKKLIYSSVNSKYNINLFLLINIYSMREEVSIMNEKQSLKKYEEPDKKNEISNNDNISLDDKEKELKNKNSEVLSASASASSLSILSSNPPDEIAEKSPDTSFDMCAIFKFTPEQDDEVALSIGDQVKIIKQKSDGWVKVKTDHGEGYVPYNYIAPIKKALYSFNPENKDEIALKKGDSVVVLGQKEAGWVKIKKGKQEGVVPESYLDM
ncbi:hypothetical protein H8356DRAFT_956044 [Neocallimastix lanati (nom. inval.)]|nr:hypothetical protein H8356DRAFT_956044 [Neocallimastix sp. JGI-2020a]